MKDDKRDVWVRWSKSEKCWSAVVGRSLSSVNYAYGKSRGEALGKLEDKLERERAVGELCAVVRELGVLFGEGAGDGYFNSSTMTRALQLVHVIESQNNETGR